MSETWRDAVGDAEARRILGRAYRRPGGYLATLTHLDGPIDVVIHSASAVSFDAPIDRSFANNVGGPRALYGALAASGLDPHVIHVSTCYVGGIAKGLRPEASVDHDVDWRAEMAAAERAGAEAENESRTPERLQAFIDEATREHGKRDRSRWPGPRRSCAPPGSTSDWSSGDGRGPAPSAGPTCTRSPRPWASGWRSRSGPRPGTGCRSSRPAIIESALRHPFPGWIDGFKVADPLIMAYGKGRSPSSRGLPDSILDVIPVDYVVNVILALTRLGHPGEASEARYYQVASGASNPLPFHRMYSDVRSLSGQPAAGRPGRPIEVPVEVPANNAAERSLRVKEKLADLGSQLSARLPSTTATRRWTTSCTR